MLRTILPTMTVLLYCYVLSINDDDADENSSVACIQFVYWALL